jgi:hypothetical protein
MFNTMRKFPKATVTYGTYRSRYSSSNRIFIDMYSYYADSTTFSKYTWEAVVRLADPQPLDIVPAAGL